VNDPGKDRSYAKVSTGKQLAGLAKPLMKNQYGEYLVNFLERGI
jgi:hypothetical protein